MDIVYYVSINILIFDVLLLTQCGHNLFVFFFLFKGIEIDDFLSPFTLSYTQYRDLEFYLTNQSIK